MNKLLLILGGFGLLALAAKASASEGFDLTEGLTMGSGEWKTNEYPKYASAIRDAEDRNGIPRDLLARMFYQETRYRADVISGEKRSPAGAVGIGQFMPETAVQYGVDRYDAFSSIAGAGRYLKDLYGMFGNWRDAVMAYNWGPGHVAQYNRGEIETPPRETREYIAQIFADVPVA